MVESGPCLGDGRRVAEHAHGSLDLGQVSAWNHSRRLVVDADLESGGTPVDELDRSLRLDGGNGRVDVLWNDVSTIQHAAGHVLSMAWITLDHLVGWLEAGVGDLGHSQLLVVGLLGRDDRSVGGQREVDAWVGHQVGLELRQIDVESSVEAEGGRDGADDLSDESVQIGVGRSLDVEVTTADVVDGFVVDHEGAVRVLQGRVCRQDGVVWLDDGSGDLWSGVDGKLQLRLLSVVDAESFHEQRSETGTRATTEAVEDEETLETGALVGQLTDSVEYEVDDLFADGVVTTGVVVGGIFLASDELFRVEELTVGSGSNLIYVQDNITNQSLN